ncbi:MAG: DMT family transporter [Pseudomonadota bacterium]
MTDTSATSAKAPSKAIEGIICVEIGMLLFVAQDGIMKVLLGPFPVWILIFSRAVVAILVLVPIILWLGKPHRLLTPLWQWHLARAALFTFGFTLFYTAFPFMGLAEVTTIFFSAPLFTAALAAFWLGEYIGPHRIGALVVGFVGVLIAMNPTSDAFQWVAILPVICAVTYAISQIIVRHIGEQETTLTVGLYTIALSGMLIGPLGWAANQMFSMGPDFHHMRWEFPALSGTDLIWLGTLGTVGMAAYLMLSRAYQVANASLVAPFDYTYLPFATLMAYVIWREVPGLTTIIGMVLIVGSGLYLAYREIVNARRRDLPLVTAESTFAPGNPNPPVSLSADIEDPIADINQ